MATKWGICSAGNIAREFVNALVSLPKAEHEVIAVAARSAEKADEFAKKFDIPNSYGNYESLAQNPNIDIVYVSTIHPTHKGLCKLYLNAGKHVLCEKPMTLNLKDAKEVLQLAKEKKLFFMEGLWSRFFPAYEKIREMVSSRVLGEIRLIQGEFGMNLSQVPRMRDLKLGGGALLDIGIYPLQLITMIFKDQPNKIVAAGHLFPEGSDECGMVTLLYEDGKMGQISTHAGLNLANRARICGTKGSIEIPELMWSPTRLEMPDGSIEQFPLPKTIHPAVFVNSEGFIYQAQHVRECLLQNLLESTIAPHKDSLQIMTIMDECRKQLGVTYDADKE